MFVIGQDGLDGAGPQGGVLVSERDRGLVERQVIIHHRHARLFVGLEVFPKHWFAVVGVVGSPKAHFVAVVDHGGTGRGHLQEGDQPCLLVRAGRGFRAVVRLVFLFSVPAVVRAIGVVQFGDQSIGVVAVDQVL